MDAGVRKRTLEWAEWLEDQCRQTKECQEDEDVDLGKLIAEQTTAAGDLRALLAAADEAERLRGERDAVVAWVVRYGEGNLIGTFDIEICPPIKRWWAVGERGSAVADTPVAAVRAAAGLAKEGE